MNNKTSITIQTALDIPFQKYKGGMAYLSRKEYSVDANAYFKGNNLQ